MGASPNVEAPTRKALRPYEPNQTFLMPASMRDWLPSDHLTYFISDVVGQLDVLTTIERYAGEERGGSSLSSLDDGGGAPL